MFFSSITYLYYHNHIYDDIFTQCESNYLERVSCRNFPSKLTRSTNSLKIGANSQAWFHWLSGNEFGNKAIGAWTIPTPGTNPDFWNNNYNNQNHKQKQPHNYKTNQTQPSSTLYKIIKPTKLNKKVPIFTQIKPKHNYKPAKLIKVQIFIH